MSLATNRTELAQLLTDSGTMTGHDHLPGRIVPPVGLVTEGQPYLAPSERQFGAFRVIYHLDLIAGAGPNDVTTAQLDSMIESVIPPLGAAEWDIDNVGQFFDLAAGGANYLAVRITVAAHITL